MAKKRTMRKSPRRYFSRIKSRAKKMTLPLAVVGGFLPGATAVVTTGTTSGWMSAGRTAGVIYTGYDYTTGKWSMGNMKLGLMPLAIGVLIHKAAGMLGINRAIAATGIPFIRI